MISSGTPALGRLESIDIHAARKGEASDFARARQAPRAARWLTSSLEPGSSLT